MTGDDEQYLRRVMNGSDRSISAKMLRLVTACAEPLYTTAMTARNWMYDTGMLAARNLGQPTISVGNLTTGGTGKTPVVHWLAQQMARRGHQPAVLLRGYKSSKAGPSDEQALLKNDLPAMPVIANPNRIRGAAQARSENPAVDLFILDDAMQHRRVHRNFEIILINALEPFGYERGLPRGMLRESLSGLRRANAILITHAGEAPPDSVVKIESRVAQFNPSAPVFHCDHTLRGFVADSQECLGIEALVAKRYFAFCGIGSPESFFHQLEQLGGKCAGHRTMADHHPYAQADLDSIENEARSASAELLITTEKDWVKWRLLPRTGPAPLPLWRTQLALRFHGEDEERLLAFIERCCPATISK